MPTDSSTGGQGRVLFGDERQINGVKIFSATMVTERSQLGDKVTDWLRDNPKCEVREVFVTQSSDEAFHCIAITVFYWEDLS